jgi:hypothetical protein
VVSFLRVFQPKLHMHFSSPPCISCPSNPSPVHPNSVWHGVQIIKPSLGNFHQLTGTSFFQDPILKHPWPVLIPYCETEFHTHTKGQTKLYFCSCKYKFTYFSWSRSYTWCKTNRTYKYISKSVHSIKLNNTLNCCVLYKRCTLYVLFTYTVTNMKAFKTITNHF